ncbi:hypothetical protein [Cupriavidus pinatubonensis]|uniref:Uncharacterized protein n=1 Tax=Cupriavidus pinatubonensis TaxID=248026 RepID=A0ABN7ZNP9_9BURK|nr:hypothetical protein [Cupriavidus pinatubonensis]CAG9187569.1 hypothetical protein LMG23994_07014 [Cupriavidus pinatubonensis]
MKIRVLRRTRAWRDRRLILVARVVASTRAAEAALDETLAHLAATQYVVDYDPAELAQELAAFDDDPEGRTHREAP